MNNHTKSTKGKNEPARLKIIISPFYFEEDPQLTPGRCWERRQRSQDLECA